MEKLYLILIEIGFVLILALMFYLWQKRRILRSDIIDNFSGLHEFLEQKVSDEELKGFEELLHQERLDDLFKKLHSLDLNDDEKEYIDSIIKNLKYHQNK